MLKTLAVYPIEVIKDQYFKEISANDNAIVKEVVKKIKLIIEIEKI